ncbi:IS1 family transposase [Sediminibacterium ginsengisoli]|uniref:IS1 family transposase n=1 Tax=Sediminibacterium ginsengisoli TaxID=413434 RepID=UPI00099B7AFF
MREQYDHNPYSRLGSRWFSNGLEANKEQVRKITDHITGTPGKVYADRLPLYRSLLPAAIHRAGNYCTNRMERNNLNIRTHLKCLARNHLF